MLLEEGVETELRAVQYLQGAQVAEIIMTIWERDSKLWGMLHDDFYQRGNGL